MSTKCVINFIDHEQGVYYPGELLKCNVQLITEKTKTLKAITLVLKGKAKARWDEKEFEKNVTYTSEILYFSSTNILQHDPTNKTFELMAGNYSYNFEMQLPSELPSSFKGGYGQIYYEVKLILSREILFDNEFVRPFTIISPLDVNVNSLYKVPIDVTDQKKTFMHFFDMTPFKMRIRIPYSAYVPGQLIPCTIDAVNESKIECKGINIKIHMHITYTSHRPYGKTKQQRIRITKCVLNAVPISTKENFTASLNIPPTPPSSFDKCKIINISYTVTVEALMAGIHRNLIISVPITIGTNPIFETFANIGNSGSSTGNPSELARALSYSMNPPSYEEATGIQFVDDERSIHTKYEPFTPLYPVLQMERELEKSPNKNLYNTKK